jgi:hypothetical protein
VPRSQWPSVCVHLPYQALAGQLGDLRWWRRIARSCDSVCLKENKYTKMISFSSHQRNEVNNASLVAKAERVHTFIGHLVWGDEGLPHKAEVEPASLASSCLEGMLRGVGFTLLPGHRWNLPVWSTPTCSPWSQRRGWMEQVEPFPSAQKTSQDPAFLEWIWHVTTFKLLPLPSILYTSPHLVPEPPSLK